MIREVTPALAKVVSVVILAILCVWLPFSSVLASAPADDEHQYQGMEWRFAGPNRGGRVNAVVGHPTESMTFYAGYTGGGIWKTEDGGVSWRNLSDGFFNVGSIGAIAVSESNPSILYAGTGEHALRGDISHGDGVYKSVDGGETWVNIGLKNTRQIAEILVHPQDPDTVYVAALGHFAGPNEERGVFRSRDGGAKWERILFVSIDAGAIEIELSRSDPSLLFAATWDVRRFPWGIRSAGNDSRIFRSRDGGDNWTEISDRPGLPQGAREKIGLGLSDAKRGRIWALVSGETGRGVYRSEDFGETWVLTNNQKKLLARTYYFNHMTADPQDPNTVYILNDRLWRSIDGGETFDDLPHNHADHHDLWIDPRNNKRIIDGTDGGAEISFNGGETWSTLFNQPTGQFYTLTLDDDVPYNLYGAQQDWSTIAVPSRHKKSRTGALSYFDTAYSEAGRVAIDQRDPDILYISDHHWLLRYNKADGGVQYVGPRDETNYGWGTADIKYRFNWTFPVVASLHDKRTLYTGSQYLHRSRNGGKTWEVISPDLTRADPETLENTPLPGAEDASNPEYWGPLTRDSNGDHWIATLYAVAESPLESRVIWTGSDDGYVHVTTDKGKSWENVTPPSMPDFAMITRIEASPHDPATAYVTASAYKMNDYETFVFRTRDYGESWVTIVKGLPENEIMRAVVSDPNMPGLLFAGGETGVYMSHSDGEHWTTIRLNLPVTPVYDMKIREDDLAIATHGRGFWLMDDLSVFRQEKTSAPPVTRLFDPAPARRWSGDWMRDGNAPFGAVIWYRLAQSVGNVNLKIIDTAGEAVRVFTSDDNDLALTEGLHAFVWDLRYPNAIAVEGVVTRGNQQVGPLAPPGNYSVLLDVDGVVYEAPLVVEKDPRIDASGSDLQRQFEFQTSIRDRIEAMNRAVTTIRHINGQIENRQLQHIDADEAIRAAALAVTTRLNSVEVQLVQKNAEARKDLHANPVALNDKFYRLSNFVGRVDAAPTPTQEDLFVEFSEPTLAALEVFDKTLEVELPRLNRLLNVKDLAEITVAPANDAQSGFIERAPSMPR
ncbi:MAG: glycosyl hydrolase [Pseudomonadota bacterium]